MEGFLQVGEHIEGCLAMKRGDGEPFVMPDGSEWKRKRNGHRGGSTMWHRFRCNDIKCPAIMLIRWDVLTKFVNAPVKSDGS